MKRWNQALALGVICVLGVSLTNQAQAQTKGFSRPRGRVQVRPGGGHLTQVPPRTPNRPGLSMKDFGVKPDWNNRLPLPPRDLPVLPNPRGGVTPGMLENPFHGRGPALGVGIPRGGMTVEPFIGDSKRGFGGGVMIHTPL